MVDTCLVTGRIVAPDGTPVRRAFMLFQRLPEEAFVADDATALPTPVTKRTANDGSIEIELIPGAYLVKQWYGKHDYFRIDVPDEPTARLEDIQDDILQPPPSRIIEAVDEAKEARDQAEGYRDDAQAARDAASAAAQAAAASEQSVADNAAAASQSASAAGEAAGQAQAAKDDAEDAKAGAEQARDDAQDLVAAYPAAADLTEIAGSVIPTADSPDLALIFADAEGNVAGGFDQQGRFVARIGQQVESFETPTGGQYVWGVTDEAGAVALGVDKEGNAGASGLNLPGYDVRSVSAPGIAFAIADEQGRAAFIVYDDGTTSAGGGGDPGPGPITHTVEWSFAETIDDPSKELFLTWLTDSSDAKVLEYRPRGGGAWMAVSSFRTRPFPVLDGLWLHTVELRNLTPDTVYEYRVPGSEYTDAVKTCPNLGSIRMVMASDWQNTDYSPSSPLRNFGDIATSKEPDLYIFNGDFSNSDGRFTEFWAEDYRTMFGVFHDHWRGAGGVQIPWVMTYGNHEASNASGTSNAYSGGDGIPGMLDHICSWTYAELHDTKFARSVSTVRIRKLVAFICLETDHTVPIASQMDWMEEQLETHSPEVAHTFLVGHNPPFHHRTIDRATIASNRYMRNVMWPIAQQYSDGGTLRAFLAAHSHALAVTDKLKMAYDPMESDAVNDRNFFQDDGGFYCIGNGAVGAMNIGILDPPDESFVSNIDGKFPWLAFSGRDMEDNPLTVGPVQNVIWPPHNIWVFDISQGGGWKAECINANGDTFYTVDETEGGQ